MKTSAPLLISPFANAYWNSLPATGKVRPVRLLVHTTPLAEGTGEEALLENILKACGLPREQMVVQSGLPAGVSPWRELRAIHRPEVILLLGITPADLGLQVRFPFILPQNFDGAVWILGPALGILQADRNLRQALWTSGLKPCFIG